MRNLSDNQLIHRAYLASPVWKAKRGEALAFYGCKCNRCGEWGNDVHHKTYERTGGNELMEDLEVLCRECHEAHHDAEKCSSRGSGIRMIHRRAIYDKLTGKHVKILLTEFPNLGSNVYMIINFGPIGFSDRAAQLLGFDYARGVPPRIKDRRWRLGPLDAKQVIDMTKVMWEADKNRENPKVLKHFRK